MKIGIITYHWANNYGAVLQTYALQKYLEQQGHVVSIVNYKPLIYDVKLRNIVHAKSISSLKTLIVNVRKDRKLERFRNTYLNLTKRYFSCNELEKSQLNCDVYISGSDQVLGPWFTRQGEGGLTSTYFLSFAEGVKIAYGASFGCEQYPDDLSSVVEKWISNFDRIGVREDTGIDVLKGLKYTKGATVVPDPTLLLNNTLFDDIKIKYPSSSNYYSTYVLRKKIELRQNNVLHINPENNPLSIEEWIGAIACSQGLITNSYHGMIVAILNHVNFVVCLETGAWAGMNDRFFTLLKRLDLLDRICYDAADYFNILSKQIDWIYVDERLNQYRQEGHKFLQF